MLTVVLPPKLTAACWRLGISLGPPSRLLRSPPPAFAHLVKSLLLYYRFDPDRFHHRRGEPFSEDKIRKLAKNYADVRVQEQINHYLPRYEEAERLALALECSSFGLSVIAVLSAGFLVYLAFAPEANEFHRSISGMIKLIAAIGTPVAVSMLAIHEAKRRQARYGKCVRCWATTKSGLLRRAALRCCKI